MSKKNYHVVPNGKEWAVRRERSERVSSRHETQAEAIKRGRDLAREAKVELRIHRPDGTMRDSDSYGNDPSSVKDRKH